MGRGELAMDLASLPPFLRTLLVTDGTVTKSIEAYFWEHVAVENLGQSLEPLAQSQPLLELAAAAQVLRRRVRLTGAASGRVYVHAESLLNLELLPEELATQIRAGEIGIGELLRERGLETYRELLEFGAERGAALAPVLGIEPEDPVVFRTYRICLSHHPAILITERFPLGLYRQTG